MEVLALTVFLSLLLAAVFIIAFLRQATRPGAGCVEREALLPLLEDQNQPVTERPSSKP